MYQQITIVGNVGRDATLRTTPQGVNVADFSVAVQKVTGSGDNRKEKTTWFKVTCWRNLADIAASYVKKGGKILVVGEVDASSYVDKSGVTQVSLELTADNFKLLSSREEMQRISANEGGYSSGNGGRAPANENDMYDPVPEPPRQQPKSGGRGRSKAQVEDESDLPF